MQELKRKLSHVECPKRGINHEGGDVTDEAAGPGSPTLSCKNKRKKHLRRTAQEIDRTFVCPYEGCTKFFGSEGSQNLHIKIKHNGGSKTDRERLAKLLVHAFAK